MTTSGSTSLPVRGRSPPPRRHRRRRRGAVGDHLDGRGEHHGVAFGVDRGGLDLVGAEGASAGKENVMLAVPWASAVTEPTGTATEKLERHGARLRARHRGHELLAALDDRVGERELGTVSPGW